MGNRYLVISDLHLADVEEYPRGWKHHKSARFVFDEELQTLVRRFVSEGESGHRLTLILNGDTVDFDLVLAIPEDPPWPVSRAERRRGLDASEPKSAWKLRHALSHHPQFVATLVEFIAAGHRLVVVAGNHDRELYFPEVQRTFIEVLEEEAHARRTSLARGTIRFEEWFFYVPGEIYAEHGNQYDYYTSFKYLLSPTVIEGGERVIALPMGNLSNRYLMSHMGYFNPHASDFILNAFRYLTHWLRHYALSRRSLVFPWIIGSLLVVSRLLRSMRQLARPPDEHVEKCRRTAHRYDVAPEEIEALGKLQKAPITQRLFRIFREFWIDRVILAGLLTGGTITLALVPIPLWIKLMVPLSSFPLLYFIYEWAVQGDSIFTMEKEIPNNARAVARTLPARVVTFGHTHVPRLIPLSRETVFVDTGTWAPITEGKDRSQLRPGYRNYLLVSFDRAQAAVECGSWMSESPPSAKRRRVEIPLPLESGETAQPQAARS